MNAALNEYLASVRFEKIALYGDQQDTASTPGAGGSDQSRTSLGLACRDWSGTNEALGVCSRDATVNRLIVDSVDHGIRQQYPTRRKLTNGAGIHTLKSSRTGRENACCRKSSDIPHTAKPLLARKTPPKIRRVTIVMRQAKAPAVIPD